MHRPHPPARISAWRIRCVRLVVLALLWGWLAAPFAQTLGAPEGGTWVQVCTSLGTRLVQLEQSDAALASESGKTAPSTSPSTDCPYCRVHASAALVPAGMPMPMPPGPARAPPLLRAPLFEFPDPPWRPALPRAPPLTTST